MQDLTSAAAAYYNQTSMMMMTNQKQPELPEQEQLKCPRCDSPNTKFCYYNNYNLSQPRHFCKNCRRYWTKGGSLRNIPVGGGSRKNSKRSSGSSSSSTNLKKPSSESEEEDKFTGNSGQEMDPTRLLYGLPVGDNRSSDFGSESKLDEEKKVTGIPGRVIDSTRMLYGLPVGDPSGGSFSSLLASNMQMGGITYETGSGWYPGMRLGLRRNEDDDTWTDLAMNRQEKN